MRLAQIGIELQRALGRGLGARIGFGLGDRRDYTQLDIGARETGIGFGIGRVLGDRLAEELDRAAHAFGGRALHLDGAGHHVTVDGGGMVWANEINTDTVVRLDPKTEKMRVVKLPSTNVGIRKMVTDASGKLWYMGSHNGRLGVVE